MQDNQPDHIDDFIKKAIGQYDVPFDEAHWNALESRLDQELPVAKTSAVNPYYISGNIITTISIVIITLLFVNDGLPGLPQIIRSTSQLNAEQKSDPLSGTSSSAPEQVYTPGKESVNRQSGLNGLASPKDEKEQVISHAHSDQPLAGEYLTGRYLTGQYPKGAGPGEQLSGPPERKQKYLPQEGSMRSGIVPERYEVTVSFPESGTLALSQREKHTLTLTGDTTHTKVRRAANRLSAGISFAPDFNSVGLGEAKKFSGQAGAILQYSIRDRILIRTGVFYNKKKYRTTGEKYSPPEGYWGNQTNGVVPEEVDGYCSVVDIPVTIGFNWTPGRSVGLITSVGLSNYVLLGEHYTFGFEDANPGAAYGWTTDETSRVLFGIANMSVAAQWEISRRFSLRVEPYLKVPLRDIGWGRVDLYSTGTFFTVMYQLAPP